MSDYRKLRAWQTADRVATACYEVTVGFPRSEEYGLKSQIRRAAVSVPANIAEGSGRFSNRDFVRFLRIAAGSASELEYLIGLSSRLGFMQQTAAGPLLDATAEVRRMLSGLVSTLGTR